MNSKTMNYYVVVKEHRLTNESSNKFNTMLYFNELLVEAELH